MIQTAKIIRTGLATTGSIGKGVGFGVIFGARIYNTCRYFSTSKSLYSPTPNDQDDLIEEIRDLEAERSSIETRIEELVKDIVDDEALNGTDEDETELSKYLQERGERADDLAREYDEYRDNAYFVNQDKREDESLLLEWVGKSSQKDIEVLETAQRELDAEDPVQEEISDLLDRLQDQKEKADDLLERWHENDLNYIKDSNVEDQNAGDASNKDSFPQDSSDITKTDFSPFDDIGDD